MTPHRLRSGSALIVTLAMVVLVTALVTAFLTRARIGRQISRSSAVQTATDIFAKGALATTVGDFGQEIVDGSASGISGYVPQNAGTMVPSVVDGSAALPNLVKQSASGVAFHPGGNGYAQTGPSRASSSPTSGPSANGRYISAARWNKALLLPKASPGATDATPDNAFSVPDWIYVARGEANPPAAPPTAASTNLVGRYAYVVYDEGGLLDANVAGYPSALAGDKASRKAGSPLAGLATLPGLAGLGQARALQIADALVGWRNYATLQPGGTFPTYTLDASHAANYFTGVLTNATGFLTVTSGLGVNNRSDGRFQSRQQLIQFLVQGVANGTGERAALQNALQYLGTFSREINQPSYAPVTGHPAIVGPYSQAPASPGATYLFPTTSGGNSLYGQDTSVNPAFLGVRTGAAFSRNDGTTAVVGEPLVKKRFALNRLCWITYKGPSASLSSSEKDALAAQGAPRGLLDAGTAANILSYFGLTWHGGNPSYWSYGHADPATHAIHALGDLASLREPDFFELLKAAMNAGSLGKGAATNHNGGFGTKYGTGYPIAVDTYQYNIDTDVDAQVLQIGANIVDQYDADSYATCFRLTVPAALDPRGYVEVQGIENLPYLYRARTIGVAYEKPASNTVPGGHGLMLLLPEVWNPHDPSCPAGTPRPTDFRFVMTVPGAASTSAFAASRIFDTANYQFSSMATSANGDTPCLTDTTIPTGSGKAEIDFSAASLAPFQKPVFLGTVSGAPEAAAIGAVPGPSAEIRKFPGSGFVPDAMWSGLAYSGVAIGNFPLRWSAQLDPATLVPSTSAGATGVLHQSAAYPVPLLPSDPAGTNGAYNATTADVCRVGGYPASVIVHYVLQYKDASGNWTTYQDNEGVLPSQGYESTEGGTVSGHGVKIDVRSSGASATSSMVSNDCWWLTWVDPRTSRFGPLLSQYFRHAPSTPPNIFGGTLNNSWYYWGYTCRPGADFGQGTTLCSPGSGLSAATGNYPGSSLGAKIGWYPGVFDGNAGDAFVPGYCVENTTATRTGGPTAAPYYFTDPDGVARRGMGAYAGANPTATTNLPMADGSSSSRPYVLNRPFQSVAELGYVFSGTPWRNLDFTTPESGAAGLLDVFCLNDSNEASGLGLVAGKVNLNTRQEPVIKALLSGAGAGAAGYAYKDDANAGGTGATATLNDAEADSVANALLAWTGNTAANLPAGKGPLRNLSDLVGRWNGTVKITGATTPHNVDGAQSYVGFSSALGDALLGIAPLLTDANSTSSQVARFRESTIRALAASGQVRTWNLMIDLVAQTGRYAPGETRLQNFLVEGERRYWLHVAIDRYTGKVLDEQLEPVDE